MSAVVPRNNVGYWIQNLDFGTYLGIVDDFPVSRTRRTAKLVARHRKDNVKTQEWVLHDKGNGVWAIMNQSMTFYISNSNTPAAAFFNTRSPPSEPSANWTVEQVVETSSNFKLKTGGGVLQLLSPYELTVGPDSDEDKKIWRLIEACPVFGQVGYVYRLRSLNNRVLAVDSNGKLSAEIHNDALMSHHRTLWVIDPASDGKCLINMFEGQKDDYLSCKTVYTQGQDNWVVAKGTEFDWVLQSIAPSRGSSFAYAIVKVGAEKDLAVTVENDQDIILKPYKVGHGQIWFLEPMDLGEVEEEKKRVREAEERAAEEARKAAEEAARKAAEAKARADAEAARKAAEAAAAAEAARRAAEAQAAETARRAQEQAQREAAAIAALAGQCPSGFSWVREATGYRCSAGGHFVAF